LGEDDGVLMLEGSDLAKQGHDSVGVQRQYGGEFVPPAGAPRHAPEDGPPSQACLPKFPPMRVWV